ncbi:hypothetical protein HKX48_007521 [Thoreauomyces humboldtii]|nr:hypothetical protein HKX48_007521 [Thoreauomyces humboldtii]
MRFLFPVLLQLIAGFGVQALTELSLGFIWPRASDLSSGVDEDTAYRALATAVDWVNNKQNTILQDTVVKIVFADSGTSKGDAIKAAYNVSSSGVMAVIGPETTDQSVYSALVTASFNIPNCLTDVGATQFEDRTSYPNVWRMMVSLTRSATMMVQFVNLMEWDNIALVIRFVVTFHSLKCRVRQFYSFWAFVAADSGQDLGQEYGPEIIRTAQNLGINILVQQTFNVDGTKSISDADACITSIINSHARIIVVAGYEDETTVLWLRGLQRGIVTKDFVWVTASGIIDFDSATYSHPGPSVQDTLGSAIANQAAVYTISSAGGNESTPVYQSYISAYQNLFGLEANDTSYSTNDRVYDCALSIFYGYDKLIKNNQTLNFGMLSNPDFSPPEDPTMPYNFAPFVNISVFSTGVQGLNGPLAFDSNGDYLYKDLQMVVEVDGEVNAEDFDYPVVGDFSSVYQTLTRANLVFYGGSTTIPTDLPIPTVLNPTWTSPIGIVFSTLAGFLLLTNVFSMGVTFLCRAKAPIKRASWKSLMMCLLGLVLLNASPFLYIGDLSAGACGAQIFVLNCGFGLVFANILAKTFRVFKIFDNPKRMSKGISDQNILGFAGIVVAIEILISTLWTATSPPVSTTTYLSKIELFHACASPNGTVQTVMTAVSIAFNGSLLAMTTFLSWKTRHVVQEYNESKWIGISVYNIVATSALFVPLVYTTAFAPYAFPFRSVAVLFGTAVTEALLFGPKFLQLWAEMAARKGKGPAGDDKDVPVATLQRVFSMGREGVLFQPSSARNVISKRVGGMTFHDVATLRTSGGHLQIWNVLARWRRCNLFAFPGYLCIEEIPSETTPTASTESRMDVYRTVDAVVRNGTMSGNSTSGSRTSEAERPSSAVASPKSRHSPTYTASVSILNTDVENGSGGDPTEIVTLRVVTLDGTLEFALPRSASRELVRQMRPANNRGSADNLHVPPLPTQRHKSMGGGKRAAGSQSYGSNPHLTEREEEIERTEWLETEVEDEKFEK